MRLKLSSYYLHSICSILYLLFLLCCLFKFYFIWMFYFPGLLACYILLLFFQGLCGITTLEYNNTSHLPPIYKLFLLLILILFTLKTPHTLLFYVITIHLGFINIYLFHYFNPFLNLKASR